MPTAAAMMSDLFSDGISEFTTNTDINSSVLDPELLNKLVDRTKPSKSGSFGETKRSGSGLSPLDVLPPSAYSPVSGSSTMAEAGSPAGVDIDNVISRRGRGVQPGDIRGPYNKSKKVAGDIIGDIIGSAVNIAEAKPKKK